MAIIGISGKIGSGKDVIGKMIQCLTANEPYSDVEIKRYVTGDHFELFPSVTRWEIKKFADKLKDIVCLLINCSRKELEDRKFKETPLGKEWWYWKVYSKLPSHPNDTERFELIPYKGESGFYNREKDYAAHALIKLTPRLLLQLLGTEAGRQIIHPNIWVNALFSTYEEEITFSFGSQWIITDVRFPNEAQAIKDKGGILIRVNRTRFIKEYDPMVGVIEWIPIPGVDFTPHLSETALDDYNDWDFVIDNNEGIPELINKIEEIKNQLEI